MWVNKKVNTFYGTLSVKYGSLYNRFSVNNKNYSTPPGVAHFLEHVKFYENKDTSAQDYFNKLGSDTNAFTTFNYTNYQVFGGTNPKDNILHLVNFVFNNYFTKKIVRGEKGIIIEEENMGEDNPYTVSLFKLFDNIFHNYEYKKLITGTRNDIKKITLEDIKLVFNNFYHPENMFLVITGNFNPYEIIEALKENDKNMNFKKYSNPVRIVKKEPKKVKIKYEEISINVTNKKIKIGIKIPRKNFKNYDDLTLRMYMNLLLKANFGSTSDFGSELLAKELISNLSYMSNIYDNYVLIIFNIDSEYKEEILKKFDEIDNSKT
jgi:predicted Zn-dependent peptidase